MTSDSGLGVADSGGRWIGVRRHQALLVLAGVGFGFDALVRSGAPRAELVVAAAALAAAAPGPDGLTFGSWGAVALSFALRPRGRAVDVAIGPGGVAVDGRATVRGYRLEIPGRLDLSGRDVEIAEGLARHLDSLAAAGAGAHASLHVRVGEAGAATVLALTGGSPAPAPWSRDDGAVLDVLDAPAPRALTLERWSYLRTTLGPRSVLRVRDFTGAAPGRSALERVLLGSDRVGVAVHADVVDAARGRRLAERAVHRVRSDGALSSSAGFRRTARSAAVVDRTRGRESAVAAGRALMRLAVYVTVRAESCAELAVERSRVQRLLAESGLVADRGLGRQRAWFDHQLPGGPGW